MKIEIKPAYENINEIRELFIEYTQMVVKNDPEFEKYLELQNYASELAHLAQKYGMPEGRLYLAYVDGKPAGCIGLLKLDEENCEMKRLYVRPEYRGLHIASQLVDLVIDDAQESGYSAMMLDTFPFLEDAIRLYQTRGFYEIPTYNNSPMDHLVYLRKDL